jgi:hypothetical protein
MLLLDTNLVSELMRPRPNPSVLEWVAAQPLSELVISAITVMEVRYGIALLPRSKRRYAVDLRFREFVDQGFASRVLLPRMPVPTSEPSAATRAIPSRPRTP